MARPILSLATQLLRATQRDPGHADRGLESRRRPHWRSLRPARWLAWRPGRASPGYRGGECVTVTRRA